MGGCETCDKEWETSGREERSARVIDVMSDDFHIVLSWLAHPALSPLAPQRWEKSRAEVDFQVCESVEVRKQTGMGCKVCVWVWGLNSAFTFY